MNPKNKTRLMIQISLLAVISFLLMYLIEFPLLASVPFLKYDPSQVPTLIASFAFGPLAGFLTELIKSFLFFVSGKSSSGIVGVSAALVAGAGYAVTAGLVYKFKKTKQGAMIALGLGTLAMTLLMLVGNKFIFFPLWGIPQAQINTLLFTAVLPFNLIKGFITGLLTLVLYKKIHRILV